MTCSSSTRFPHAGSSLLEVMFALVLVSYACAALFSIYSSAFPLVRRQQETMAATLSLQERLDRLRFQSWPVLTNAGRLQQEFSTAAPLSGASLSGLVEDITISVYPPPSVVPTPLRMTRQANGVVTIVSQPLDTSLSSCSMVRIDLRDTWQVARATRAREISTIIACGGILR